MKKLSTAILFLGLLVVFGVPTFSHALPNPNVADVDPNGDTASNSCVTLSSTGLRYRATDYVTGGEVSLLQDFLISKGFLSGQPTGFFGSMTFSAVKNFQKSVGFSPTGYVGNLTKAKIKELSCGGATVLPVDNSDVVTVLGATPVSLINEVNYSGNGNNGGAFVRLSIKGYPNNKQVDHWVLGYTCQSGVTLDTGGDSGKPLLCNGIEVGKNALSFYSRNMFDPRNDYVMITANAQNKNLFPAQLTFTLDARDSNDKSLGSFDTKTLKLSGYQAPCPTGQTWNGSACAIIANPIPSITSAGGMAASNGEIDAGGKVEIQGNNLSGYKDATNVYIGGKVCTITESVGSNLIYCIAPSDLVVGSTYDLYINTVRTGGDKVTSNIVKVKVLSSILSPVGSATTTTLYPLINSVYLQNVSEDKAGLWANFGPGTGNINKNSTDWNWVANITIPSGASKYIKRITVIHNTGGEVWSTGYSRYLGDGTDLYGREEHPYPLVVTQSGVQLNKSYDQSLGEKPFIPGTYELKLYGQPENTNFTGGKLIVEFTDGTKATAIIPASSMRQNSVSILTQPSITVLSPNGGEILQAGQIYNIKWNSQGLGASKVNIELWTLGSSVIENSIATNAYNSGSFVWSVPKIATNLSSYFIIIRSADSNPGTTKEIVGRSAGLFTIAASTTISQPSITVLSPNGGERFVQGGNFTGSFTTSNISYGTFCEVAIVGRKPDGNPVDATISTLNTSATDKQVYSGKLPMDLVPAGSYKVRVDCGGGKLIAQDSSDSYFTITSPQTTVTPVIPTSLTVLTPINPTTHGDTFSTGETVPLAWSSKEFGVNRIYLLSETGDKVATILATNDNGVFPYTGSTYSWKISDNIPTGTYKVRVIIGIEGLSTSPVGDSGTFRIRNTVSSNLPIQTPTRIINVYSPQGGEQLAAGQVYRIRWNNSAGVDKVSINLKGEDGTVLTIAELSNNPNFYDWTPTTALAGSKYKIEVVEGGNVGSTSRAASVSGASANYFLVTGGSTTALPSIHLLQPIGGETFTAPGTMSVRWEAFNLPANTTIDSLNFSLVKSVGTTIPLSVTKESQFALGFNGMWNTTGRGAVTAMKIPSYVETGSYRLQVSCASCGTNVNVLSNAFNVTGQPVPATPTNMTSNLLDGLKLINPSLYR